MTVSTDDILQHAGVKGMKWGVRKSEKTPKKSISVNMTSKTEQKRRSGFNAASFNGTALALPAGIAVIATRAVKTSKAKKRVASALNSKPSDFSKKDLKNAALAIQDFSNLKITSNGKSIVMSTKLIDILQHAGVKGMKWGVRKSDKSARKSAKVARKAEKKVISSAKLNAYHDKKMAKSTKSYYARTYKKYKDSGVKHETSIKVARNMNIGVNASLAYMFSPVKVTPYGKAKAKAAVKSFAKVAGKEVVNRTYNAATSDKARRVGKNIVLAATRSKVRVINAADLDWSNMMTQSAELNDILQHAGVKGMKWGVRKKARKSADAKVNANVKSGKISKKEGKDQKLNNYHKSKKKGLLNAAYQNDYDRARSMGSSHKSAVKQAKFSSRVSNAMTLSAMAVGVTGLAGQGAGAAYRKVVTPENIRRGKNVVLAAKRSKIRVVDGSTMESVIGAAFNNRLNQSITYDDILQHAGVKGMKWGVRKDRVSSGVKSAASKVNNSAVVKRVKDEVKSARREGSWSKIKVDGMTTEEVSKVARRVQLENEFKRMSKTKNVGTGKDKKAYRQRESMSDQDLMMKVTSLRAKESFDRNMRQATKTQRTLGRNILDAAGPLVVTYALTQKIGIKDIAKAAETLKRKDKAVEPGEFKAELAKTAFGTVREVKTKRVMGE